MALLESIFFLNVKGKENAKLLEIKDAAPTLYALRLAIIRRARRESLFGRVALWASRFFLLSSLESSPPSIFIEIRF